MGICFKERNKIKVNTNEDAPLPVISSASPGERILPELNDSSAKPTSEKILPELNEETTKGNNIIKMKINVEKKDINKPTKILYNLDVTQLRVDYDLKQLNESNTELFINGKQCKYKSYFIPKEKGVHQIKLIIKILMKNCCCLFYGLSYLKSIDLSLFNTQNVTNMSYMFCNCNNLNTINFSSFNTQNVTSMNNMFYNCNNLQNIDLSSFNTQNVTDMSNMFYGCENLNKINLSSFNTIKVTDMHSMFYGCKNLKKLRFIFI